MQHCKQCNQDVEDFDYAESQHKCNACHRAHHNVLYFGGIPMVYAHLSITPGHIAVVPLKHARTWPTDTTPELSVVWSKEIAPQ